MLQELLSQSLTQWIALVAGIAYVWLAAREKPACWIFGIISCCCIAYDDFLHFRLYTDGVLQIIYVGMGFLGLYQWMFGQYRAESLEIHELPWIHHLVAIVLAAGISYPIYLVLIAYTDARFGYADTLTTILSIYATWLLARKVLSNWLYWIVIDAVYVYLYFRSGGGLVAILFVVFTAVSVYGYVTWRGKMIARKAF